MKDFSIFCEVENSLATDLAGKLGIKVSFEAEEDSRFMIKFVKEGLYLLDLQDDLEIEVNFKKQIDSLRSKGVNSENLIKALGKLEAGSKIFDLTAGLGRDALIMALKGYEVVMIERHPVLYTLLKYAHMQLQNEEYQDIFDRIKVVNEDSRNFLEMRERGKGEVFYLDPMFPKRVKSAKVKKEMQILQNICDLNDNVELLIKLAVLRGKTILKRPKMAGELALTPHHIIAGSKINFLVFNMA